MAPKIHQILTDRHASGSLEVLTGHVTKLGRDSDGRVLATLDETNKEPREQSFDYVVNCSGPNTCKPQNPITMSLKNFTCSESALYHAKRLSQKLYSWNSWKPYCPVSSWLVCVSSCACVSQHVSQYSCSPVFCGLLMIFDGSCTLSELQYDDDEVLKHLTLLSCVPFLPDTTPWISRYYADRVAENIIPAELCQWRVRRFQTMRSAEINWARHCY